MNNGITFAESFSLSFLSGNFCFLISHRQKQKGTTRRLLKERYSVGNIYCEKRHCDRYRNRYRYSNRYKYIYLPQGLPDWPGIVLCHKLV